MPTPFSRDQLSPAMQERYGLNHRPVGRWITVVVVIAVFVGALAFVATMITRNPVDSELLTWKDVAADRVDVRIVVRRTNEDPVTCVLRAQDQNRIDVGYARIEVPAGGRQVELPYSLRTLARAFTTQLLGCAGGDGPNVAPPQFPPGVVPPDQPWS